MSLPPRIYLSQGCVILGIALGWTGLQCSLFPPKVTATPASPSPKPLIVHTGIQLRELRLSNSTPDQFRANFIVWYSWYHQSGQNWSPDKVQFTNAIGSSTLKVPIWTKLDQQRPGQRFEATIYEGDFKTFSRYQAFPVDAHLLTIRMICPKINCGNVNFFSSPDRITFDPHIPQILSGWKITGTGWASRQIRLPEELHFKSIDPTLQLPVSVTNLNGFVFEVHRDLWPGIILIFIPMLLIWLLAYIGLYWDDSSPASRFGATALFAAIAFNLATLNLQPAVAYVTLMSLAFLALYVNILIIVVTTTLCFHLRAQKLNHRQISYLGRGLSPAVLLITILLLIPTARLGHELYFERNLEQMQFQALP
jgi:hypothetical protein